MRSLLILLLSVLVFQFPSNRSSLILMPLCNHHDAFFLLSFKSLFRVDGCSGTSGWYHSTYPKTESWKNGSNCCLWDGVSCDAKSGHVIGLDLSCSCLQGQFHPNNTLFKLTHLQKLNLAFNYFIDSPMPSNFGDLVALTHLNLSYAGFSGVTPSKISHLSKLVSLDLSLSYGMRIEAVTMEKLIVNATQLRELILDNLDMSLIKPSSLSLLVNFSSSLVSLGLHSTGLHGKLVNKILSLPNLQELDLSTNAYLEGELPQFNSSTPLRHLDLSLTAFSGHIRFLSNLPQLKYLALCDSEFSGEIPLSLSNLQHLTYIDLSNNNFTGPIPECMGNISQLHYLVLRSNNFIGEIPSSLFNLQHLIHLDLSYNNFDGEIPNLFGKLSKLEVLDISRNNLVGQLPSTLFGLTKLRDLSCFANKLLGAIPEKNSGLSNLANLDLSDNSLNGTIPLWCFSLSSLLNLNLGGNQLTGAIGEFSAFSLDICDLSHNKLQGVIPESMFLLQNLSELSLSSNNLSGHLDFHKFSNLQQLEDLDLSHNTFLSLSFNDGGEYTFPNLHGLHLSSCRINSFPKFLSRLNILTSLDLSNNQIHGRIPKWFSNTTSWKYTLSYMDLSHNLLTSVGNLSLVWEKIYYIDLSFNMLEGDIPVPPFRTEFVFISNNKLTGDISSALCHASSLEMINLSYNNLTGMLPECLGTFPYLSILDLRRNNLSGMIPRTYLQIESLETMNFNGNQLEGPLPRSVVKCKQLRVLDLGENNIEDTFPNWLESLQELQVLVLRANRFNGSINSLKSKNSFPMLRVFDISNNNFSGNLPTSYFENFKEMMVNINNGLQYMSTETYLLKYYDSIVVTIKGEIFQLERILTIFTTIDLSNNRFEGVIPAIIGELKSLKGLNLSHNRISGCIPQTLGGLENLEWLDLSSNMLMGEIPNAFTNLHYLSVFNLSQNQLVGTIPTGKQFDTFQNDSYQGNPGLCGLPLSKPCHKDKKHRRNSTTFNHDEQFGFGWKPVVIGYGSGVAFGIVLGYFVFFIGKPQWSIRFVEGILNQRVRKKSQLTRANRTTQ